MIDNISIINGANILVADDNPENLQVIESMLHEFECSVRVSLDGEAAIKSVQSEQPELILLDIHMPVMDGYETCQHLKADESTRHIPVIFVSAMTEQFNKTKAFEVGAVDYITKPINLEELRLRIGVHLHLSRQYQQLLEQSTELDEFGDCMINRETKIIELKCEINALSRELNRESPYPEVDK